MRHKMFLLPEKPKMRFSTLPFRWILLCALWISGSEMTIVHRRKYDFVTGLAFNLECNKNSLYESVSWTRVAGQSLEKTTGINIKGNVLWFLPADLKHNGSYSCLSRKGNDSWETVFDVFVRNETCPRWNRRDELQSTTKLSCFLPRVFELDPQAEHQVTWRNNCQPLNGTNSKVFPVNRSPENVGVFTCFVNFTFEGRNYSAAQTTQIHSLSLDDVVKRPEIIYPKQEIYKVTIGQSFTLKCKAYVGRNAIEDTTLYWFSDSTTLELDDTTITNEDGDPEYMESVLNIPEVTEQHLHINFTCVVQHEAGSVSGTVVLVPASQNERYYWVGLGLTAVLISLVAVAFVFRVDLVLAYRDVCSRAVTYSDGKSYDAYVSYLHGDPLGWSSAMTFALHLLPEVLEDLHGYKLFISGRDELPGEAVHDVVADRMSRSRRLIIVLTPTTSHLPANLLHLESEPSCEQMRAAYEQRVGLYDALVKQGLKVILVQVEDGVEEAQLPETLRYISHTKGVLHWRQNASGRANGRFWKHMRYHMPPCRRRKSSEVTVL